MLEAKDFSTQATAHAEVATNRSAEDTGTQPTGATTAELENDVFHIEEIDVVPTETMLTMRC